jgi:membrane protein required for colicin V production
MFNWLDIVLLTVFAISMLSGLAKGFARVGIGAAATFFGILFAIAFYSSAGSFVQPYVSSLGVANFVGFILILAFVSAVGSILSRLVSRAFKAVGLGWLDRLLGAGLGAIRALIIAVALVMAIVAFTPNPPAKSVVQSSVAPYVLDTARVLVAIAPQELRDGFLHSYEKIKDTWHRALRDGREAFNKPLIQKQ